VQRKQALAKELRLQIHALIADILRFNIEKTNKQSARDSRKVLVPAILATRYIRYQRATWNHPGDVLDLKLQSEISIIETKITVSNQTLSVAQNNLTAAETPPALILQPLPRGLTEAMKVLYFLHMPSAFISLLKLSVVAQQMLIPRSFSLFQGNTGK
jgi:hypothetical protein